MDEYIKREDAINAIKNIDTIIANMRGYIRGCGMQGLIVPEELIFDINKLPAADVRENVRGNWIGIDDFPHDDYECDRCGEIIHDVGIVCKIPKFCPNCGADMRGVENEN